MEDVTIYTRTPPNRVPICMCQYHDATLTFSIKGNWYHRESSKLLQLNRQNLCFFFKIFFTWTQQDLVSAWRCYMSMWVVLNYRLQKPISNHFKSSNKLDITMQQIEYNILIYVKILLTYHIKCHVLECMYRLNYFIIRKKCIKLQMKKILYFISISIKCIFRQI